jgi:type I restriction enzyme S subunit
MKNKLFHDWVVVKLDDIAQIVNGTTPDTSNGEYWGGDIVWITPKDLGKLDGKEVYSSERLITKAGFNSCNLSLIPRDSIVLSTRAPIGYIAINKVELCFNQGCKGIIASEYVDNNYLFYFLFQSKNELENLGSGATFKELSTEKIKAFEIILPPISEQKRIADIIKTKLQAVEKVKKAMNEQLELMKLLFLSYLQKVLSNKKWNHIRLGDVCEFIGGSQPPKSTFVYSPQKGYIRLVQIQDFRKDDAVVYIHCETAKRIFGIDDIMIGRYGPPVFQILRGLEGAYNVALMKAKPINENILNKNYLFYLLQEKTLQNAVINQSQRSAGQSGVDKEFLKKQVVYIPDIKTQKIIAEKIDKYKVKVGVLINLIKDQLSYIETLQSSILRQVFRGEL